MCMCSTWVAISTSVCATMIKWYWNAVSYVYILCIVYKISKLCCARAKFPIFPNWRKSFQFIVCACVPIICLLVEKKNIWHKFIYFIRHYHMVCVYTVNLFIMFLSIELCATVKYVNNEHKKVITLMIYSQNFSYAAARIKIIYVLTF